MRESMQRAWNSATFGIVKRHISTPLFNSWRRYTLPNNGNIFKRLPLAAPRRLPLLGINYWEAWPQYLQFKSLRVWGNAINLCFYYTPVYNFTRGETRPEKTPPLFAFSTEIVSSTVTGTWYTIYINIVLTHLRLNEIYHRHMLFAVDIPAVFDRRRLTVWCLSWPKRPYVIAIISPSTTTEVHISVTSLWCMADHNEPKRPWVSEVRYVDLSLRSDCFVKIERSNRRRLEGCSGQRYALYA